MPAASVAATAAIASSVIASTAVVVPASVATVTAVVASIAIIAPEAVIAPAITWRATGLIIACARWRSVIAGLGVIARLRLVIARLRRHVNAPLLVVGGTVAIVIGVPARDDGRRLRVHIGFVVTRASITTSKEEGQQNDKRGSSIHGGLPDRDWHKPATLVGVRQSD